MMNEQIWEHLNFIYGPETAAAIRPRLAHLLSEYQETIQLTRTRHEFDQRDAVLITYGDMIHHQQEQPLHTLVGFLKRHLQGVVNTVHLLPFYPASSDDGFSVIDYRAVDPAVGDWEHIGEINRHFRLMFDAVINHISVQSRWFQAFLADDPQYRDYFVTVDPSVDLSAVFRPRALPLLTEFQTAVGPRHLWTTFSPDQVDLNYANPDLLLAITDLLLFYVSQGAKLLRLDAIAFMWKEIGSRCIHLPNTHRIIQLWRSILDLVAPQVALITETNVPHQDNITYFGDGTNEAQMVYNFSLPPLTLHAFHTGNAELLTGWAKTLAPPSKETTFFNFLASHDGIGLTPAWALLPDEAVAAMAERALALGGRVSYRHNSDGSQSAYELNINYLDALGDPQRPDISIEEAANRFLASQAIMLALPGVPGIYFHSLFGSNGWPEGVRQTGRFRSINRQKLPVDRLESELGAAGSLRQRVFSGYRQLLAVRANSTAFHPHGRYEVLSLHPAVFAILRIAPDGKYAVLCLHNVSAETQTIRAEKLPADWRFQQLKELISGRFYLLPLSLPPHSVLWLEIASALEPLPQTR
jgi:glucosylglycerate phosphorylase